MKKFWIALQICENEKYYAYMVPVTEMTNLCTALKTNNPVTANICPTKKEAVSLVTYWNESFKRNGTFLFDETI